MLSTTKQSPPTGQTASSADAAYDASIMRTPRIRPGMLSLAANVVPDHVGWQAGHQGAQSSPAKTPDKVTNNTRGTT